MRENRRILIQNIYHMLAYAFQALRESTYSNMALEPFDNVHNLFSAILIKGIGVQLKRGLYREYLGCQDDLPYLRGKLHMPGMVRNCLSSRRLLACEYDEISENNLPNQILKTTVLFLLRSGRVRLDLQDGLKRELPFFSRVDVLEPAAIPWTALGFQRGNQTYRMLLGICRLVLEGMLLTDEKGEHRLASFVDGQRMSRLYEKFILEYYIQEFPELSARAAQIPWALDGGSGGMLPVMQSDITLEKGTSVLIIDAKYYAHATQSQYGVHTVHSQNLYQIFTYVKNRSYAFNGASHRVSGLLLYARTDEAVQPGGVYQMHGSQISVQTLDLNTEFSQIAAQLNAIAASHFGGDCGPPDRQNGKTSNITSL